MLSPKELILALAASVFFRSYAKAFSRATGLPLALRPTDSWVLPHHGQAQENSFCALMSENGRSCALCSATHASLTQSAREKAATITCLAQLSDSAIPVQIAGKLAGWLHTGQIQQHAPTPGAIEKMERRLGEKGIDATSLRFRKAYAKSPVIPPKQYRAMVDLLRVFAAHLSLVGQELLLRSETLESAEIARARQYLEEHYAKPLTLAIVSRALGMTRFHFCKSFKDGTGVNFTEYVSRLRVEHARALLLNRQARIGEVAYEVGFQSLANFNRIFKRITGESPTHWRGREMAA